MRGAQPSPHSEQQLAAISAEVTRLTEAKALQKAADTALSSLQDKIADLKVSFADISHNLECQGKSHTLVKAANLQI